MLKLPKLPETLVILATPLPPLLLVFGLAAAFKAQELQVAPNAGLIPATLWLSLLAMLLTALRLAFRQVALLRSPHPQIRLRAGAAIAVVMLSLGLGLLVSEAFPVTPPPDKQQNDFRILLRRRNRMAKYKLRGSSKPDGLIRQNNFGYPDRRHPYERTSAARILFLGDSFLEVLSTKNLPSRVGELLGQVEPVVTINLSLANTGPPDYRWRLIEQATQYHPDLVVINLYEGNDLDLHYRYQEYRPRPFQIPYQAVELAVQEGWPATAVTRLKHLSRNRQTFTERGHFLSLFPEMEAQELDLLYLCCLAFSEETSQSNQWFQRTRGRLSQLSNSFVKGWLDLAPKTRATPEEIRQAAVKIYDLPKDQRLPLLCELIGVRYFGLENGQRIQKLVEAQGSDFIEYLVAQGDLLYYLLPALRDGLEKSGYQSQILTELKPINGTPEQVEECIEPNLKLFRDMTNYAKSHGTQICFVLAPEASQVDAEFQAFWGNLSKFPMFEDEHQIYLRLAQELPAIAPTLDLAHYPQQMRGGYWKYDGHWNEAGNAAAAELVARFVQRTLSKKPDSKR